MELTVRDAVTILHGIGFGALVLLMCSGAAMALYALSLAPAPWRPTARERRLIAGYFTVMTLLAWAAVLVGAYVVYPWYRAVPPAGAIDLAGFPQRLLMSRPATAGWHDIGMEWKEHIAWFAPISLTALAYLVVRHGAELATVRRIRAAAFGLALLAFIAVGVAGFFGAMLNKFAPVRGGGTITLLRETPNG